MKCLEIFWMIFWRLPFFMLYCCWNWETFLHIFDLVDNDFYCLDSNQLIWESYDQINQKGTSRTFDGWEEYTHEEKINPVNNSYLRGNISKNVSQMLSFIIFVSHWRQIMYLLPVHTFIQLVQGFQPSF